MRKFVFVMKWGAYVTGVLAAGLLLGWLANPRLKGSASHPEPAPLADSSGKTELSEPSPPQSAPEIVPRPVSHPAFSFVLENEFDVENAFAMILDSETTSVQKAQQLLDLFPVLPPDKQTDAALLLCNLVPDESYSMVAPYLRNPSTETSVRDVLLANLLERPDPVRLPLLAELARDGQNPAAAEAQAFLGFFQQTAAAGN